MRTNSYFEQLRGNLRSANVITRLIVINIAVFIIINLFYSIAYLLQFNSSDPLHWLAVPAAIESLAAKPWTLITYMFVHEQFWHILFNMLTLYFAGILFSEYLTSKRILACYFLGGIAGALLYIISYNVFPVFSNQLPMSVALGASASVMAILVAVTTYVPNYTVNLLLFGPVKLKYITIVYVVLDFLNIRSGNAGGHIAHIGGALFGYLFVTQLKRGRDWSKGFNNFFNFIGNLFRRRSHLKVAYKKRAVSDEEYNASKRNKQKKIDDILDKISKSGYESLTKEEKETLFRISNDKN